MIDPRETSTDEFGRTLRAWLKGDAPVAAPRDPATAEAATVAAVIAAEAAREARADARAPGARRRETAGRPPGLGLSPGVAAPGLVPDSRT